MTNEQMLCLLYHEAKFNVVQGRYALYTEEYHRLAGLQVSYEDYVSGEHLPLSTALDDLRSIVEKS